MGLAVGMKLRGQRQTPRGGEAARRAPRSPTTETARGSEGLGRGQWRRARAGAGATLQSSAGWTAPRALRETNCRLGEPRAQRPPCFS